MADDAYENILNLIQERLNFVDVVDMRVIKSIRHKTIHLEIAFSSEIFDKDYTVVLVEFNKRLIDNLSDIASGFMFAKNRVIVVIDKDSFSGNKNNEEFIEMCNNIDILKNMFTEIELVLKSNGLSNNIILKKTRNSLEIIEK